MNDAAVKPWMIVLLLLLGAFMHQLYFYQNTYVSTYNETTKHYECFIGTELLNPEPIQPVVTEETDEEVTTPVAANPRCASYIGKFLINIGARGGDTSDGLPTKAQFDLPTAP